MEALHRQIKQWTSSRSLGGAAGGQSSAVCWWCVACVVMVGGWDMQNLFLRGVRWVGRVGSGTLVWFFFFWLEWICNKKFSTSSRMCFVFDKQQGGRSFILKVASWTPGGVNVEAARHRPLRLSVDAQRASVAFAHGRMEVRRCSVALADGRKHFLLSKQTKRIEQMLNVGWTKRFCRKDEKHY